MRTIGIVTTSRADYGIYRPLLRRVADHPKLRLVLFVSGTHLSEEHGMTLQEIERDGWPVLELVEMPLVSDTPEGIATSAGMACVGFGRAFGRVRPDWLVVLGDRYEMFAAAYAALPFQIPVLHIHGGELTEGAMDDALRHGLTKFSHLHAVSTETYRHRVIQLGEEPWRVHCTGALSLDNLEGFKPMTRVELEQAFGIDLGGKPLLVTFHPVTTELDQTEAQIGELLAVLSAHEGPVIFTQTNADTHGSMIRDRIRRFCELHTRAKLVPNFGMTAYFSMMTHVSAMVGNSSSGLLEAPSFRLPVVNIGSRQQGRVRAANVVDVPPVREEIQRGLARALDADFLAALRDLRNPYGDGQAAGRMVELLVQTPLDRVLLQKRFHNIPIPTGS